MNNDTIIVYFMARRTYIKKRRTPQTSFISSVWGICISFLKMYIPDNPEKKKSNKKSSGKRSKKYIATKRT